MNSPSSSNEPSHHQAIVGPLLVALVQTSSIIFLGYLCMALGAISYVELTGIKKFCGRIALPAIFFLEVANINWGTVEFRILFGMFSAKVLVFVLTSIYVCMRQGWQPKGSMQSTSVLSTMGIFCIFATKSNDIALGVPLINAAFQGNTVVFSKYLYLFAPFQLLILNVTGFVLLEIGRYRQEEQDEKKRKELLFLRAISTDADTDDTIETQEDTFETSNTSTTSNTTQPLHQQKSPQPSQPLQSKTAPSPPSPSVFVLLPRVLWNVMTTPPVLSVILGLITNVALTIFLSDQEKASRPQLLPSSVNNILSTVGQGYAVTALFSIGAGMYGCFSRAKLGTKEILDGLVLIFMKTLFMAFVTNRMIAIFMTPYKGTEEFADAVDFGWLYGMTPVAPTVYIFAEMYGIHIDFMALFANVCMLVAGPMMVLSGAALESIKGLSFSKYMELHDVLVRGMAWVGVMMCIPLFIGMLGSRWFLHFPCDFIMVLLAAYIGYSLQTLMCINDNDMLNNTATNHSHHQMPDTTPAFVSFFFETLFQTHAAGLCVYLALKKRSKRKNHTNTNLSYQTTQTNNDPNNRLRVLIHIGSIVASGAVTFLLWSTHVPQTLAVNSQRCAVEFVWRGVHGIGEDSKIVLVGSIYQLLTFIISSVALYKFHKKRSDRNAKARKRNNVGNSRGRGSDLRGRYSKQGHGMKRIDENEVYNSGLDAALLNDVVSDYGVTSESYANGLLPNASPIESSEGTRQESHYGLYPSSRLQQAVSPQLSNSGSNASTSPNPVGGGGGAGNPDSYGHNSHNSHNSQESRINISIAHYNSPSSRSISSAQRNANTLAMLNASTGGGTNNPLTNHPHVSPASVGNNTSISSPTRILVIVTFALVAMLARFLTDTLVNFKIASTIEISLLAVILTYMQGMVIALLYVVHPIVLNTMYECLNYILLFSQPEEEIDQLAAFLQTQQQQQQQQQQYEDGSSSHMGGISTVGGTGSETETDMEHSMANENNSTMESLKDLSNTRNGNDMDRFPEDIGGTMPGLPTLRLTVVDEETDTKRSQSYSSPRMVGSGGNTSFSSRTMSTARPLFGEEMNSLARRRRANKGRLISFRTRGGNIL